MSIIGLSSRIGGGKDTVAKIIQRLEMVKRAEEGQISAQLVPSLSQLDNVSIPSKWKIKKFAGVLKEVASLMTGIPIDKFEDQEFKKTQLGAEWDNMTVRVFLQKLGTEAIRDGLHVNAWVNSLFADYKIFRQKNDDEEYEDLYPCWCISDMRFVNEFLGVRSRGGYTVRINRGNVVINDPNLHPSETGLDSYFKEGKFDYVIQNNGTLEDLELEVIKMLQHFNLY